MPFTVGEIANFILDLADRDDISVTPMQLQKLVYLAHGWHLGIAGEPLIDETVEAWKFGPVIPSLYQEFKRFGSGRIVGDRITHFQKDANGKPVLVKYELSEDDEEALFARALIERVWKVYQCYSGVQLSILTHQQNTPWSDAWNEMETVKLKGKDIDNEKIKSHFKQLARA